MRLPSSEILAWSARYSYSERDDEPLRIGAVAQARGYFTRDEFLAVGQWKSKRPGKRRLLNSEEFVRAVTSVALSTADERLRIEVLLLLDGVEWPTASVLLHFAHKDRYPILDFRAVWSVGLDMPSSYCFEFWQEYTRFCREIAARAGVSMRDLDRAMWAYSKEHQVR